MIEDWEYRAEELLEEEDDERCCLAFLDGVRSGIEMFAWWKDGVEYVGTGSCTKREMFNRIDKWIKKKGVIS